MKRRQTTLCYLFLLLIGFTALNCRDGDTIKVTTIKFGQPQRGWFLFPDSTKSFQKILMNYKIKCPCGEWDYLAMVFVKQFFAPNFRVDSTIKTEYSCMWDTSWDYNPRLEGTKLIIDSVPKKPRLLEFYNDSTNPTRRTSYRYVWDTYYRYVFDEKGNILDSIQIPADTTLYLIKKRIDYQDPIALTEQFEIMRFVTPYGIGLDVGDGFTWTMDVTDFAPLLSGKVYLDAPNQQEEIEITFDFIEGIPERNVIRLQKIYDFFDVVYDGNFENKVSKKQIHISPEEKMFRLKVLQTGHGFGGNEDNCCEFCKKKAFVKVNDTIRYTREVWRRCSDNPLYPQGGTWLFARTNWCPGAEVQPFDFELSPYIYNTRSFTFDYDMEFYNKPYASGSNTIGRWIITAYVISYSELNFKLDAEVYDIEKPSIKDQYKRVNPTTTLPRILVKNRGVETIYKLKINYGIVGYKIYTYEWLGIICPLEIKAIELPPLDCADWKTESRVFKVEIVEVNGKFDEYPSNNIGFSKFELPPSIYKNLTFNIRTNNFDVLPFETSPWVYKLTILDKDQNIIAEQEFTEPNKSYALEQIFDDGCYEMIFENAYECGLGFWFYKRIYGLNDGNFTITSDNINIFQPNIDFGSNIYFAFIAEDQPTVSVYPDTLFFDNAFIGNDYYGEIVIKPSNKREITIWDVKIILGESKGLFIEKIEPPFGQKRELTIGQGDSIKILVKFKPTKPGKVSTSLTFASNDKKNPLISVPIRGFVAGQSGIEEWLEDFDFSVVQIDKNLYEFHCSSDNISEITFDVFNLIGCNIATQNIRMDASSTLRFDFTNFSNGLYLIRFQAGPKFKIIPITLWKN